MRSNLFHFHIRNYLALTSLLFVLTLCSRCQIIHSSDDPQLKPLGQEGQSSEDDKQRGAHVFGIIDSTDFQFLKDDHIEWITLVPWGFQPDFDSPKVSHHDGGTDFLNRVKLLHEKGFKVFVKPHVWIHNTSSGKWRSDIFPKTNEDWEVWKETYRAFIMRYAKLAEEASAEQFCVGTEFSRLSKEKPAFWKDLIQEVRAVYSGKLTYAANWYKEYEDITFWGELDFIGIQAYFPLVDHKNPSTEDISAGWDKYLTDIESLSQKTNRKIIFTEMGYKSTADGAMLPWEWVDDPEDRDKLVSLETQANSYQAFYETVWPKEWFSGVHIWQMRSDYTENDREYLLIDFTPQNKPAEKVISNGFDRE